MTATVEQVVAVAASQVGYYEAPGGARSKYESWYPMSGYWCAMGLSWVFALMGALDIFPKHAYTPSGVNWFKDRGQWRNGVVGVRRGDIVYFDFPGAPARVSHVGIVESVNSDGSVNTIEFNTATNVNGDQRNGGCVARKRRKAYITGFGRPSYSQQAAKPTPELITTIIPYTEDDMTSFATEALTDAYYEECGRAPSNTELAPRRLRLAKGESTLKDEVVGIDKSIESNRWAVHKLYVELLNRGGGVGEWDNWISSTGNDIVKIRAQIVGSPEYKSLHP